MDKPSKLTTLLKKRGRGSREALARAAGISRQTVNAAENGKVARIDVCRALLAVLPGFTIDDLTFAITPLRPADRRTHSNGARKSARA